MPEEKQKEVKQNLQYNMDCTVKPHLGSYFISNNPDL